MKLKEVDNSDILSETFAEIAEKDHQAGEMLKTLGLKVKGNEDEKLNRLCAEQQLDETDLLKNILNLESEKRYALPNKYHSWTTDLLVQYIIQEHHIYTRSLLADALDYANRAEMVHSKEHPQLSQVKWYLLKLEDKLSFHLKFQENKFFPAATAFLTSMIKTEGKIRSIEKQVQLVKKDQEEVNYLMSRMGELTNGFTSPDHVCTAFRLFYSTLKELNFDLKKHHFLEEEYLLSSVGKRVDLIKSSN